MQRVWRFCTTKHEDDCTRLARRDGDDDADCFGFRVQGLGFSA